MRPHRIHAAQRAELREEVVVRPVAPIFGLFSGSVNLISASSKSHRKLVWWIHLSLTMDCALPPTFLS